MARPQLARLHFLLECPHDRLGPLVALVVRIVEHEVERLHLLTDEAVDPVELLLECRLGLEVPHRLPPGSSAVLVSTVARSAPRLPFRAAPSRATPTFIP